MRQMFKNRLELRTAVRQNFGERTIDLGGRAPGLARELELPAVGPMIAGRQAKVSQPAPDVALMFLIHSAPAPRNRIDYPIFITGRETIRR